MQNNQQSTKKVQSEELQTVNSGKGFYFIVLWQNMYLSDTTYVSRLRILFNNDGINFCKEVKK